MLLTKGYMGKVSHWWEFLWAMTENEIKTRYKFAILGFLWMILNPILQMLVMGFIFSYFIPVKFDNYFIFLFSGLLVWNFFSYTVLKNTPMFINERSMIQKAKFPRESIILSISLSNFFHFIISLFIFLFIILFFGKLSLNWLYLPFLSIWVFILAIGSSFVLSTLNVKYRDVNFAIGAIMPLLFYATPVVYTLDLLPDRISWILYLNPMTSLVELFRFSILGIRPYSFNMTFIGILTTIVILFLGIYVFKREGPFFDDWM